MRFPEFLISSVKKDFSSFQAVAIGPGLKDRALTRRYLSELKKTNLSQVVVDAEALNLIARAKKKMILPKSWILTPHEGEMARLLKTSSKKIKADRVSSALELQKKFIALFF